MKRDGLILTLAQGYHEDFEVILGCVYTDREVAAAELEELLEEVRRVRAACEEYDATLDDGEDVLPTFGNFGVRADGSVVRTWLSDEGSNRLSAIPNTKLPQFGFANCNVDRHGEFSLRPILVHVTFSGA